MKQYSTQDRHGEVLGQESFLFLRENPFFVSKQILYDIFVVCEKYIGNHHSLKENTKWKIRAFILQKRTWKDFTFLT